MQSLKPLVNTLDRSLSQFDCVAFVSVSGQTLLTRQYAHPCQQMRGDLEALEQKHGGKVYVVRSFTNHGNEVAYEIITPNALKDSQPLARVEFWSRREHAQRPSFTEAQQVSKSLFCLAGILLVPMEDSLHEAYDYLEYPFSRWNPNLAEGASPAPRYGDILVVTSMNIPYPEAYALTDGYTPVVLTD